MTKFNFQKQKQLAREDKSNEQQWDKAITGLCGKINKTKEHYTTSSCAGRIILIKGLDEKAENVFLFKTHDKVSFEQLKKELENAVKKYKGLIYFKQETCILHVASSGIPKAQELLNKAKTAGWKRSGIMATKKRVMLELLSTERTELPVADNGKILVDDDYLKLLVQEANKKLERTREKIKKLEKLI